MSRSVSRKTLSEPAEDSTDIYQSPVIHNELLSSIAKDSLQEVVQIIVDDNNLDTDEDKMLRICLNGNKACDTDEDINDSNAIMPILNSSNEKEESVCLSEYVVYVNTSEIFSQSNSDKVPPNKNERKLCYCAFDNCRKSYSSPHHLKIHMRVHSGDRPFKCTFPNCLKAFSTGFGLKTHLRTHNNERPYKCFHDSCLKKFKTSGDLQKHTRIHTGERPFLCPLAGCGRSFTTGNICKVHIRTHTGERPYSCTYEGCFKTFASMTNHRNHLRIHSGERPYACSEPGCERKFTEYSSLYKHNQVHSQLLFGCHICSNKYRSLASLDGHIATHQAKNVTLPKKEDSDCY